MPIPHDLITKPKVSDPVPRLPHQGSRGLEIELRVPGGPVLRELPNLLAVPGGAASRAHCAPAEVLHRGAEEAVPGGAGRLWQGNGGARGAEGPVLGQAEGGR